MLNLPAFAEVPPAAVTASAAALDRSEGVAVGVRARNEWRAQRGWSSEPGRQEQHAHRKASASSVLSWEKRGGQTPLHRAAACGHTAVVKALLAAGADSAVRDAAGFTIVHTIAAAAATAAERGEWAELGRAAVDIARKLLAVSEGGRWQEKAGDAHRIAFPEPRASSRPLTAARLPACSQEKDWSHGMAGQLRSCSSHCRRPQWRQPGHLSEIWRICWAPRSPPNAPRGLSKVMWSASKIPLATAAIRQRQAATASCPRNIGSRGQNPSPESTRCEHNTSPRRWEKAPLGRAAA